MASSNFNRNSFFSRVDYSQIGLTSKNCLQFIRKTSSNSYELVVGDHSGSLHYFNLDISNHRIETIFKTLPGPNSKISCIDTYSGFKQSESIKILSVCGPSTIKGFNKKGKQFFILELSNLTESIAKFRICRSPDEIHVLGQYIYNSYQVNSELVSNGHHSSGSSKSVTKSSSAYNSVIQSRHYYVSPSKINDFILMEDRLNRKIGCQDRLIRVLKDSVCYLEIEVCGIPSVMQIVPKHLSDSFTRTSKSSGVDLNLQSQDVFVCYGTMDGKISLLTFKFLEKNKLEPIHNWEVPLESIKQPITCLRFSESTSDLFVGRSDGSIEIWQFSESIRDEEVEQRIDLTLPPSLIGSYNCGESITNLLPLNVGENDNLLLIGSTFTGVIFGLFPQTNVSYSNQINPNQSLISNENIDRIRSLQNECLSLEKQLNIERDNYVKSAVNPKSITLLPDESNFSVLPFFAINDSFVLHNDGSYLLMLESEVSIDVVFLHTFLALDLIDCEKNSAVISYNDRPVDDSNEILVTFRCQSNTNRMGIRMKPVEGQNGWIDVYIISRIMPKSCQARFYQIHPLSLHKRQYSNVKIEFANKLVLTGPFNLNDALNWMRLSLPEIPDKLSSPFLPMNKRQKIEIISDNVSSVSILKDFLTREVTRQSIEIGIEVYIDERSLIAMLVLLFPHLRRLVLDKQRQELNEALRDLKIHGKISLPN
ncbi:Bardet-Biedl syndrome 7 protein [Sarcoptes scabiei]|uniref:Bardet-Biedl syndrome 7 protein n=1 Tax=Sarcoptes scabiei TaxID=52283 RepID=A0A834RH84_SARSC|nr:Bardet-Biedl syndrome 7 protein [Sarcoptes scabiei]